MAVQLVAVAYYCYTLSPSQAQRNGREQREAKLHHLPQLSLIYSTGRNYCSLSSLIYALLTVKLTPSSLLSN
jgi:hypothetical protein